MRLVHQAFLKVYIQEPLSLQHLKWRSRSTLDFFKSIKDRVYTNQKLKSVSDQTNHPTQTYLPDIGIKSYNHFMSSKSSNAIYDNVGISCLRAKLRLTRIFEGWHLKKLCVPPWTFWTLMNSSKPTHNLVETSTNSADIQKIATNPNLAAEYAACGMFSV